MAIACYHCGKEIKGGKNKMVVHVPPLYLERMGLDFSRSYHPKCYDKSEKDAAELIAAVTGPPKTPKEDKA